MCFLCPCPCFSVLLNWMDIKVRLPEDHGSFCVFAMKVKVHAVQQVYVTTPQVLRLAEAAAGMEIKPRRFYKLVTQVKHDIISKEGPAQQHIMLVFPKAGKVLMQANSSIQTYGSTGGVMCVLQLMAMLLHDSLHAALLPIRKACLTACVCMACVCVPGLLVVTGYPFIPAHTHTAHNHNHRPMCSTSSHQLISLP